MAATSSTTWFWSDWLGDQEVRRLTPEERGVWIDMLALAAAASPVGYVCDGKGRPLTIEEIARVTNASPEAVSKLIVGILDKGAASRDRTGRIYNRRMVRDAAEHVRKQDLKKKRMEAGRSGGQSTSLKYFGNPVLLQQMPRQRLDTKPILKNIEPLKLDTAREALPRVERLQEALVEEIRAKPVETLTLTEINILRSLQKEARRA